MLSAIHDASGEVGHLCRWAVQDVRAASAHGPVRGVEEHQLGRAARRDFCAPGSERRRQDHADQHHLRDRHRHRGHGAGGRPRQPHRLPRRAAQDRPGAARAAHRRVRNRVEDRELQPRPVGQARQPGVHRAHAQGTLAVGQERQPHHDHLGRHEAPPDDRQGARPRAGDSVFGRAHRRRRRRAASGHVGAGAAPVRERRHNHPHHALHPGSRADGRPRRRHQQRRADRGRRKSRAHDQARQEAAGAEATQQIGRRAGGARRLPTRAWLGRHRAGLHLRHRGRTHRRHRALAGRGRGRYPLQGPFDQAKLARRNLRQPGEDAVNLIAIRSIYVFEMSRWFRTVMQSILSPVISTSLYFVVFGAAIGSRFADMGGVNYGSFIVPGLIMLMLLTQSVANASFGIYFPRFTGTIYEILSAPVSYFEIVLAYVGAAATKSILLGLIILATAGLFVPVQIIHPLWMILFLLLTAATFSLLGFIIGIWADGFEQLQLVPLLIITPLTFLGGTFYSISMLPDVWQKITLVNPVVYLVSGFRWSFYGVADLSVAVSLGITAAFLAVCLATIAWIFKTGYRLKT